MIENGQIIIRCDERVTLVVGDKSRAYGMRIDRTIQTTKQFGRGWSYTPSMYKTILNNQGETA